MSFDLITEGRRVYVSGNTNPIKDALRDVGAKWDGDRKMWWVGTGKRSEVEALVSKAASPAATSENKDSNAGGPGDDGIVAGRAKYKGQSCYLAGRVERGRTSYDDRVEPVRTTDGAKLLLFSRDGARQWWAARSEVEVDKHYDRPQKIGKLRDFAEKAKTGEAGECDECGKHSIRLIECSDSSGLSGQCCAACARMSASERSFA